MRTGVVKGIQSRKSVADGKSEQMALKTRTGRKSRMKDSRAQEPQRIGLSVTDGGPLTYAEGNCEREAAGWVDDGVR